jgi:hypothetical protein
LTERYLKDDRKHRSGWRELYTDAETEQLHRLITACRDILQAL